MHRDWHNEIRQLAMVALLTSALLPLAARGEIDSKMPDERREKQKKAEELGKETTNKMLTPPMMMHFMKAAEHEKKAEEADEKKDPGTAQQERQMAQQEQQKGQQLQQQIQANNKSGDENRKGADKLQSDDDPMKGVNNKNHIIVDQDRKATGPGSTASAPLEPASNTVVPKPEISPALEPQLARLDDFSREKKLLDDRMAAKAPPTAAVETSDNNGKPWERDLAQVGDRTGISFNDSAPSGGATRGASAGGGGAVVAGGASDGPAPQDRLLSAANEGIGQSTAAPPVARNGALAEKEKKEKDASDKDFWESVDGKKRKKTKRGEALARGSDRRKGAGAKQGVVAIGSARTSGAEPPAATTTTAATKP